MLGQMYYELFWWCGHGLQLHQYLYLLVTPPCVRQEGHKPLAEYTRRRLSNMCVKGGVCIMPATIVRGLSVIVREKHSCFYQFVSACFYQFVSANHTKTFNDAQA